MSDHAATGTIDHHHDPSTSTGIPNKKLLLWAFLASDCMFFGTLISTHLVYRQHPPPDTPAAVSVFNIELTSFSTFILLMSSLMMALAVSAIQRGNVRAMRSALLVTIFFGLTFLWCQVYEFNHFVFEKHMTITNSIFGSTFFTLTGTHGTHVAIGVLWLVLMYIRSFKPAKPAGHGWVALGVAHLLVFAVAIVSVMNVAYHFVTLAEESAKLAPMQPLLATLRHATGAYARTLGESALNLDFAFVHAFIPNWIPVAAAVAGIVALKRLSRPRGAVDFGETNAIDVESMGLYWHFVDIVWIVIFTAVYLLEYV
jgi:cytochrome o ubiquinol oxidase subunit 3